VYAHRCAHGGGARPHLIVQCRHTNVLWECKFARFRGGQPECMFLTSDSNVVVNCMGCVRQKGEKFCMKWRNSSGEQDTCRMQSQVKNAISDMNHLYFWDAKQQGYVEPLLSMTHSLESLLYEMRREDMMRVELNKHVGLIVGHQINIQAKCWHFLAEGPFTNSHLWGTRAS
jgi:hypothetical protein